jgi:hypothetical protein
VVLGQANLGAQKMLTATRLFVTLADASLRKVGRFVACQELSATPLSLGD